MVKRKDRETSPAQEVEESVPSPSEPREEATNESGSSSSNSGCDASDTSDEYPLWSPTSQEIVNVDFEFFDPKPVDFHGTKALLRTYLDDVAWDINGFVDLFLAQSTVGSVVKTSEEDSPIGIISVLNLARYQDCPCLKQVRQYLQSKCREKPEARRLEGFWTKNAKDVGLLVSERLINIPIELVPPLHDGLFEEVLWATEDEPTQDLRDSFKFKHYLVLTKVYEEKPRKSNASQTNPKHTQDTEGKRNLIFIKPEDELFLQISSWSFTFPVRAEVSAAHETKNLTQSRLVMGINAKQIPTFMSLLKGLAD